MKRIFGVVLILIVLAAFTPLGCFAVENFPCNNDTLTAGEYQLTEDCSLGGSIDFEGSVTLNLNGFSLTSLNINSTKDLTIVGPGKVDNSGISIEEGDLTINGGTVTATDDGIYAEGSVMISGGQVSASSVSANKIKLGWTTKSTDFIYAQSYEASETITAEKTFRVFSDEGKTGYFGEIGTGTVEAGPINGKWLYPPEPQKFIITWKDHDGSVLKTTTVTEGDMPVYGGEDPTRARTAQYSYTFTRWDPDPVSASAAAEYTAVYTETVNQYKVTFTDEDGTTVLLEPKQYAYGTKAADIARPADPVKPDTQEYTYTFAGWDPALTDVTDNVTYKASYTPAARQYEVTFTDEDGTTVLKEAVKYAYGTKAADIAKPADPVKPDTQEYTYTFAGWSPEIADVTENVTYKAVYTGSSIPYYSVTFVDEDGTVLKEAVKYAYGTKAADIAKPADPVKPATAEESFTFAGWSPEIADVTEDATYKAAYEAVFNGNELTCGNLEKYGSLAEGEYVLTENCTYNGSITLNGNVTIDLNAKKLTAAAVNCSESSQCSLTIRDTTDIGELDSVISVTGDLTINGGVVKASGNGIRAGGGVSFSGGQVITEGLISANNIDLSWTKSTDFIHAGSYSGTIKAEKPFSAFSDKDKTDYRGEIGTGTVEAGCINGKWLYPPVYTINWMNDGMILKTDIDVLWGTMPAYSGKDPERAPADGYRYVFSGWKPAISPVTGDAEYTALYTSAAIQFSVTINVEGEGSAEAYPDSGIKGKQIEVEAYSKWGWRFREWRVDSGSVMIIDKNKEYSSFTMQEEDVVITVIFEPEQPYPEQPYDPVPSDDNEPPMAAANKTYVIGSGQEKKFRFEQRVDDETAVAYDAYGDFERALKQAEASGGIRLLNDGSRPVEKQPGLHEDYDYSRGSLIITLFPAYLDTLPVGEYTMETFFMDESENIWSTPVHLSVTEPGDIKIFNIKNDANYGIPEDIDAAEYTLTIQIYAGDRLLREAKDVTLTMEPGRKDPCSLQNVPFTVLSGDDTPDVGAAPRIVITGLPEEVIGYGPEVYDAAAGTTVRPVRHKYALSVPDARFSQSGEILLYLLWDDGSRPVEEIRVVALPEDEIGAYQLRADGTKEYLLFQTYDICMAWLGSDELCRGPERCYHK